MSRTIHESLETLVQALDGVLRVEGDSVEVLDADALRTDLIDQLAFTANFGEGDVKDAAQWLIRRTAFAVGAYPASIHDLYMAAGRGEYSNVTTPAINVRTDSVDFAGTIFKAMMATDTKQVLFELAKSENGYTKQNPGEFASSIFAAAIKYGYQGPVMVQGDHFQINAKKWAADPEAEFEAVKQHTLAALAAGYGNIDIDSSTIVDYSVDDLNEQQAINARNTAEFTKIIRDNEPEGWTISVGCEIGEVGQVNSTVADLEAFYTQYRAHLDTLGNNLVGVSKASVQTGTSHGGTLMPDGTMQEVAVDFDVLAKLSAAAKKMDMGGAVQHGASTLPEEAFGKFAQADAVEVHLATAYQNMYYDSEHFPADLREQMYAWLDENHGSSRKEGQADNQFYYSTRKNAFGPFKQQLWELPQETKDAIYAELQPRYELVFRELGVANNSALIEKYVKPVDVPTQAPQALVDAIAKA